MISSRAFAEAHLEESSPSSRLANNKWALFSTEAVTIVLLCFFAICSFFTSSALTKAAVDLAIKDVRVAETHNMKTPLSLPLNVYHVELGSLESTDSPFTSVPQNLDGTVTAESQKKQKTDVMSDMSADSIEHYQRSTSNSNARSVSSGWWSWVHRLILMSISMMVGEGSSGTPPDEEDKLTIAQLLKKEKMMRIKQQEEENRKDFSNIVQIIGGPDKLLKFFCEVHKKKCKDQNREYSEAEAKDAWMALTDAEKKAHAKDAFAVHMLYSLDRTRSKM